METDGWGRFLLLGSASNISGEMIHYGVSKTAEVALARGLAKRMSGTGVTVNSVLPAPSVLRPDARVGIAESRCVLPVKLRAEGILHPDAAVPAG